MKVQNTVLIKIYKGISSNYLYPPLEYLPIQKKKNLVINLVQQFSFEISSKAREISTNARGVGVDHDERLEQVSGRSGISRMAHHVYVQTWNHMELS